MFRDVTWGDWKPVDPRSNMDAFVQYEPTETVPGIDELIVELKTGPKEPEGSKNIYTICDNEHIRSVTEVPTESKQAGKSRLSREMRRLHTSYNPTKKEDEAETGKPAVRDGNVVVTGNVSPVPIEVPSEAET